MIKHIVMWTISDGETSRVKLERMAEVKSRLLSLKGIIPEMVSVEVRFNAVLAPQDNFDVILITEFNSWADLEIYKNHPDHLEVADYIRNVKKNRVAIDYEFDNKPQLLDE
jgi:hypothetical protein